MLKIVRLTADDEAVALQASPLFDRPNLDGKAVRAFLVDARNCLLLAMQDERPIGFALAYELPRLDTTRPMMFLYELAVAAEHRRQGVGQALVEELKRLCRERGFLKMLVLTKADNLPARELYVATDGETSLDDVLFWYGFTEEK